MGPLAELKKRTTAGARLFSGVSQLLSILVSHSYFLNFDEKQRRRAKPYPPLATLHVAALLREAGHTVEFFDAMLAEGVEAYQTKLDAVSPQLVLVYEDNFNFLSKMCLGRMRIACCSMIRKAQSCGARVIVAGSDASDAPAAYLSAGADAVLLGEGLASLVELVDRLDDDVSLPAPRLIAGLADVAAQNVDAKRGIPSIPAPITAFAARPAWDLVDIEAYRRIWTAAHGYFSLNMAASRGCSFRCSWCAKPIWGNRYLQRGVEDVAAEALYLKENLGAEHIWFVDDIFGFRADWVARFAELLAASGGSVPFTIQLRADLVSTRMADALSLAGCSEVWIGAESGSQRILDAMNKGTHIRDILRARRLLGGRGIRVGFFLMLGYLGETLEDILATRDLVARAGPDDVGVSVAYPLPGTKFFEKVRSELGEKRNWQESNDLEMMFGGTYTSGFYRLVRDLLHDQVSGAPIETEARWRDLVAREAQFRQAGEPSSRLQMAAATVR